MADPLIRTRPSLICVTTPNLDVIGQTLWEQISGPNNFVALWPRPLRWSVAFPLKTSPAWITLLNVGQAVGSYMRNSGGGGAKNAGLELNERSNLGGCRTRK